ncbi:MAG: DUF2441 domain-containing protein [Clostridia bacterium]
MIAYHIDRTATLVPNQNIDLVKNIQLDNILDIYNNSISKHGLNYLNQCSNSATWEICLEFIRLNYFPNYPSRFQSFFGVKNLKDAQYWYGYFADSTTIKMNICKIQCSKAFEFDANWLNFTNSTFNHSTFNFNNESLAHILNNCYKYWNKEKTENPMNELIIVPPVKILEIIN